MCVLEPWALLLHHQTPRTTFIAFLGLEAATQIVLSTRLLKVRPLRIFNNYLQIPLGSG